MKRKYFSLILAVSLLLTACGKGDTANHSEAVNVGGAQTSEEVLVWDLQETVLPDADEALNESYGTSEARGEIYLGMAGDTVFRYVQQHNEEGNITHYYVQQLQAPYEEWQSQVISLKEKGMVLSRQMKDLKTFTDEGELYFLFDTEGVYYREQISLEKGYSLEPIPTENISAEKMEELLNITRGWYVDEGKDYLCTEEGMQLFTENFSVSQTLAQQYAGFAHCFAKDATQEKLYLYGWAEDNSGSYIWQVEQNEAVLETGLQSFAFDGKMDFYSETEGYLCDATAIYRFSLTDGSIEKMQDFNGSGYYPKEILGAVSKEDESLVMLAQFEEGYSVLNGAMKPVDEAKKTLELAASFGGFDSFLEESIVRFNKQSKDYRIVLRERSGDSNYWEDYCNRINAEISSGAGPDLFMTTVVGKDEAVPQGIMLDLTDAFADVRGEVVENLWADGMANGRLYTIPYNFRLDTLAVPQSIAGDKAGWTLEELMQMTGESGKEAFIDMGFFDNADMFFYLGILTESNPQLVDWEKGVCNLNGEEALELLAFSQEYALGENWNLEREELHDLAMTEWISFSYMQDLQDYETRLYAGIVEERVYMGYPSHDGKPHHIMNCNALAVNANCKYPEGAVEFLHFLISEEVQGRIVDYQNELKCGFPVRRDSIDRMMEKAMEGYYNDPTIYAYIFGDEEVRAQPMSERSVEQIWEVIENAVPRSTRADDLYAIIAEETAAYYAGEKLAQEVLDIMQNRAQLYLDEMK